MCMGVDWEPIIIKKYRFPISTLVSYQFLTLTFWQKMDFWPVLQFWLQRKNGRFTVPTLRFGSVVSQGHFFGDPDHLTEFHRNFLKNKAT